MTKEESNKQINNEDYVMPELKEIDKAYQKLKEGIANIIKK